LTKEDDVRKYVIRRELPAKEGKDKKVTKAPKIQRLVTPLTLQRKRRRLALKAKNGERQREAAAEYAGLLQKRIKEAKEKKEATKRRRSSSMRESTTKL